MTRQRKRHRHYDQYGAFPFAAGLFEFPVVVLFEFAGLAGATLSWLTTFLTPSVSLARRSASVFASAVSTWPRSVTSPSTTSTLIFRSGVCLSLMSLATTFVW